MDPAPSRQAPGFQRDGGGDLPDTGVRETPTRWLPALARMTGICYPSSPPDTARCLLRTVMLRVRSAAQHVLRGVSVFWNVFAAGHPDDQRFPDVVPSHPAPDELNSAYWIRS
jgi:hypothetical protein